MVIVPLRGDPFGLAATLYGTLPLPVPLVAPVSVIHDALLAADQAHPAATVRPTLPVPPPDTTDWLVGESVGAQGGVNEKPFETVLAVEPPGPMAVTRASKTVPGVRTTCSNGRKSTRMMPLTGAGLPRSIVSVAVDDPVT
jgi:hypothetical protein